MTDTLLDIPTLTYERALWQEGVRSMAGVDEVGRGALAGPLTAAAVILPPMDQIEREAGFWSRVRDSKTISGARRSELAAGIISRSRAWGVAAIEVSELDQLGVSAANRIAMERAIMALDTEPDLLLIDAMTVDTGLPQMGIVDGDALSLSIAAASIVAKVARDSVMVEHDPTWPMFGFARHKGYGVATHLAALREHGPCPIHRRCFAPVRAVEEMRRGATRGEG
jgi:ribonuclease HII